MGFLLDPKEFLCSRNPGGLGLGGSARVELEEYIHMKTYFVRYARIVMEECFFNVGAESIEEARQASGLWVSHGLDPLSLEVQEVLDSELEVLHECKELPDFTLSEVKALAGDAGS